MDGTLATADLERLRKDFSASPTYRLAQNAANLARRALDAPTIAESALAWRELLGPEFPEPKDGGFTQRTAASTIASTGRYGGGRFG